MEVSVNGRMVDLGDDPEMPLLWALRDLAGLRGTKYGCGIGVCGACTVLIDGSPRRSCRIAVGEVSGDVTTIEGIATPERLHAVQRAWIEHQVAQCGYCQSGQILAAVALLSIRRNPSDSDIARAMRGNLCRCGTYPRIRAAIRRAAAILAEER